MDDAQTQPGGAATGVRWIDDAATFKAMADPVRLAMLRQMMSPTPTGELRNWSAKELAGALAEPQTKLYRHIKQLEEAGLVKVAETRLVSGIVEQRYAAAQTSLEIARDFLRRSATRDETADLFAAGIDAYRRQLLAAVREGRIDLQLEPVPGPAHRRPLLMFGGVRLPPDRASAFRERLAEVLDEFVGSEGQIPPYTGADAIELNVMLGCYEDVPAHDDGAAGRQPADG